MVTWLLAAAWAAEPERTDQIVTGVGAQAALAPGVDGDDVDLMLSERLRWGLVDLANGRITAIVDGRFTIDPSGTDDPWEQTRVRSVEARLVNGPVTIDLGRSAVYLGGPRLVDGVQARVRTGALELGVWGGEAPDLFTTRPAPRFGGGPILALQDRTVLLSAVGEFLVAEGGLDRAAVLVQGAFSAPPTLEVSGRLDAQVPDDGGQWLSDGAVEARLRPADSVRLHALYEAFSTVRYLGTGALDPDVERWIRRLQDSGVADAFVEDLTDPRLYHLVGVDGRWQPAGSSVVPRIGLDARYRYHPNPDLAYVRVGPNAAAVAERFEVQADAQLVLTEAQGLREDLGLTLLVEPTSDGRFAVDTSARLLLEQDYAGKPGFYGDLFVTWLAPAGFVLVAGGSTILEPLPVTDPGFGAFVQLQHWLTPSPRSPASP
ncbi:MAG: hypothetical protein H6738_01245 [Alphaproteobacteria bacterium]|nr:hypothetical protein [Alphaproteobacteria bacterium]MCB9695393.1 hypothetical protein [Alphaproteobacteria bacterium]